MTSYLLAIDPSINSCGVAEFIAGELVDARTLVPKVPEGLRTSQERACDMACVIEDTFWRRKSWYTDAILVVEWPQVYKRSGSKGPPSIGEDLLPLAGIVIAVAALLRPDKLLTPTPAEWIGQLPKSKKGDPWKSPRGLRIAKALTPEERKLIPKSHDAIDAVGLGLWALKRLNKERVLPGATEE